MPSIFGRTDGFTSNNANTFIPDLSNDNLVIIRYTFKLTVVIVIPLLPQLKSMRPTT